ncbi:MAG: hypothetical protein OEV41_08715, partial [Gammaproteobacteria bacterium]|nr:hypothetical protein [Gammaproteobacteria bacterium]
MKQYSVTRRPSALAEFAYHTIAAIVLLLFVSIRLKQAIWSLEPRVAALALLAAGGYWLAATSLLLIARRGRSVSAAQAAAICLAAATVVLIAGSAAGSGLPRIVTLEAPLLGLALLLLGQVLRARLSWTTVTATAALAVVGLAAIQPAQDWLRAARRKPSSSQTQIRSSLYDLNISAFRHYTPRTSQSHGGLALFGDRYLLADGGGNLFVFQPSADLKKLDIKALAYRVPINSADFSAAAGTVVHAHLFRVAGVISQE